MGGTNSCCERPEGIVSGSGGAMASMGGAATSRSSPATPPDKGSFPLDRTDVCGPQVRAVLECLRTSGGSHIHCRKASEEYLKCRMENKLMAKEDLGSFGFGIQVDTDKVAESQQAQDMKRTEKLRGGFIAGLDATNARK